MSPQAQRALIKIAGGVAVVFLALNVVPFEDKVWTFGARVLAGYLALWLLWFAFAKNRAGVAGRFLLVTFALGAALIAMEAAVFLKVADFRAMLGTHPLQPWYSPQNKIDPELFHIHQPYLTVTVTTPGDVATSKGLPSDHRYTYTVKCDKNGFRNETDMDSAEIAVIGDSFVEGLCVEAPELMTAQLAKLTGKPVANLGQAWYGPQQELVVLKRFGVALKPKVAVWCFYEGNDLGDAERYVLVKNDWAGFLWRVHGRADKGAVKNLLRWVMGSKAKPREERPELWNATFTTAKGTETLYFYYPVWTDKAVKDEGLPLYRQTLAEGFKLCRENGIKLIVVFIPKKSRIYLPLCTYPKGSPYEGWVAPGDTFPREFADVVKAVSPDIGVVDTTEAMTAAAKEGVLTYAPDDSHWNATGHRIAAEAISRYLQGETKASER